MVNRSPLIDELLPRHAEWWGGLVSSPWLTLALLIFAALSAGRHGELAYGSNRLSIQSLLIGWGFSALFFGVHLLAPLPDVNLGLLGLVLIIMLSDSIISSLSHSRSPFFVHNMGVMLGLLLFIHPISLLLYPFYIAKLRRIESASARHITALFIGSGAVMLLATLLFAEREGWVFPAFFAKWAVPLLEWQFPSTTHLPCFVVDLLYLLFITIGYSQLVRTSVVRVRSALHYHLQLTWLLMFLHFFYGWGEMGGLVFVFGTIFTAGIMSVYFISTRSSKWIALPMGLLTLVLIALQCWHFIPTTLF